MLLHLIMYWCSWIFLLQVMETSQPVVFRLWALVGTELHQIGLTSRQVGQYTRVYTFRGLILGLILARPDLAPGALRHVA